MRLPYFAKKNDIGNGIANAKFQPAVSRNSLKNEDNRKLLGRMGWWLSLLARTRFAYLVLGNNDTIDQNKWRYTKVLQRVLLLIPTFKVMLPLKPWELRQNMPASKWTYFLEAKVYKQIQWNNIFFYSMNVYLLIQMSFHWICHNPLPLSIVLVQKTQFHRNKITLTPYGFDENLSIVSSSLSVVRNWKQAMSDKITL